MTTDRKAGQQRNLIAVDPQWSHNDVLDAVRTRSITEVLHFTTSSGILGILASSAVKSRKRIDADAYLEHIYRPNVSVRRDPEWVDHVSLSISRINDWMFEASERWHIREGVSWAVVSLTPDILSHPGVVFSTTNNIYPARWHGKGVSGFERMFAESVVGRYGEVKRRRLGHPQEWTTDRQAEVLYPGEVPVAYVQRIDVQTAQCHDDVAGMLGALDIEVHVRHDPQVFE
jgi:ssDNA thymidine ADP-ribosyltransferase, DarT